MIAALLAILAAVTLSPPFGEASAAAVEDGSFLTVTVTVAVDAGFGADYVVVHVLNPDGQETFTLGESSPGAHVGTFTIQPFNRALAFEVGKEGASRLSRTVSLVDLGVDVELLQTTFAPSGSTTRTRKWGWLALGTAALAAAVALAWFAWPQSSVTEPPLVDAGDEITGVVEETE